MPTYLHKVVSSPPGVGPTTDGMDESMKLQFQAFSLLRLIALLLAIRIDHTSERKSAILLNFMEEISRMDIHYQMSRHNNIIRIDMPERHDTGSRTLLYGRRAKHLSLRVVPVGRRTMGMALGTLKT